MSDNNKDLGDKAEDAMDNAKKKAENLGDKAEKSFDKGKEETKDTFEKAKEKTEKAFDDAKDSAKDFSNETKESAKEFSEGAKNTANEFTAGAKEAFGSSGGENKKILAGILAIVLGSLGVHKFILGYQKEGFILLGISVAAWLLSCLAVGLLFIWIPYIIGLIEGIIYLTKTDEEFYNTYQVGRKPWF